MTTKLPSCQGLFPSASLEARNGKIKGYKYLLQKLLIYNGCLKRKANTTQTLDLSLGE